MQRKYKLAIAAAAVLVGVLLIVPAMNLLQYSSFSAGVWLKNASADTLSQIKIEAVVDGKPQTLKIAAIEPGKRWAFECSTEITFGKITFLKGGQEVVYTAGGIATKGEVYVLEIAQDGNITGKYLYLH